ncbi:YpmA family protein [Thermosyntropha sp.]|uniref:YpmA family protein n=1 Tax=Thermosyntropha sp. TaxID=2740820 RepID=UPI0025E06CC9|nr:YpmA family protein [Thermosyntropha sp.]MBO8158368.1 YpmA family protein [Thermosyntropha sp.]
MDDEKNKLELIATKTLSASDELVRLVDFLNKNLKNKRVMFGITKNKEKNEMTISIYEF